ncbi:MAG: DUF2975 domain-containing protein [Acidobacteriia bacterium]|nr:DUF2975 domain-containing protein [Terriglobia bacterium]
MGTDKRRLENTLHDFLDLILVLGACACAIWIVILLYGTVWLHATPHIYDPQVSLTLPDAPVTVTATRRNTQFVAVDGWKVRLATFETASVGSIAVQLGWILLQPGMTLIIVWLIRGMLVSIEAGVPFHQRAPGRLKAIGWLIIAGAVGRTLEDFLVGLYIKSHYAPSKGAFTVSFDYSSMLWGSAVGIMVIVLAGVFRYGYAMRQEQELTV